MDNSSIPSLSETGQYLLSVAKSRWLFPEEIYILLAYDPLEYGIEIMKYPVDNPINGQLLVFSSSGSTKYDTVSWAKKKSQGRIQETYMNLKINGTEMIRGIYCKAGENANFRRRIYRLIKGDSKQICIVHYRTCTDDEKPERPILSPQVSYFLNQHMLPRSSNFSQELSPQQPQVMVSQQPPNAVESSSNVNMGEEFDNLLNDLLQTDGDLMDVQSSDQICNQQNYLQSTQDHYNNYQSHHYQTVIMDFAPEIIKISIDEKTDASTKILICLNDNCSRDMIKVRLTSIASHECFEFYPERLTLTVLRLMLPRVKPGRWIISLLNQYDQVLYSNENQYIFVIQEPSLIVKTEPPVKLGKRHLNNPSPKTRERKSSNNTVVDFQNSNQPTGYPMFPQGVTTSHGSVFSHAQVPDSVVDREYKIRIVEKLGSVKSALLHDESDHSTGVLSPMAACATSNEVAKSINAADADDNNSGDMVWLDEVAVSKMSNAELEIAMDQYITTIMQELVNFAALDDDLKAEINSLDPSGFSLLHYCSLYDLTSLIPILVARGAEVNQHTSSGSTPLHLAVAAGHVGATEALIANGADINAQDANSLTANEIARQSGFEKIHNILFHAGGSPHQFDHITGSPLRSVTASPSAMMSPEVAINPLGNAVQSADRSDKDPSKLLHKVFASLSLTDKCALSISMKQHVANSSLQNTPRTFPNFPVASGNSDHPVVEMEMDLCEADSSKDMAPRNHFPYNATLHHSVSSASLNGNQLLGNSLHKETGNVSTSVAAHNNEEDISDIQSVLSFQDNESLEKAMSLMGDQELQQVEEEVRKIQNNVRGWILRKNYVNLREAAKVLQSAWREKKKSHGHGSVDGTMSSSLLSPLNSIQMTNMTGDHEERGSSGQITSRSSYSEPSLSDSSHGLRGQLAPQGSDLDEAEVMDRAAATLQAATRRMIARKSFSTIRKQTMASLVIQKNLLKWWVNNKQSSQLEGESAHHLYHQFN